MTLFQRLDQSRGPRKVSAITGCVFRSPGPFLATDRITVATDIMKALELLHESEASRTAERQIPESGPVQILHRNLTGQSVLVYRKVDFWLVTWV